MAEYIAVHRLVVGGKKNRSAITPGERFDAEKVGLDEQAVRNMLDQGAIRLPNDQDAAPPSPQPASASTKGEEATTQESETITRDAPDAGRRGGR